MDTVKGGCFLLGEVPPESVFIPEDIDEMHKMVKRTIQDFCREKVVESLDDIEARKEGVMHSLIKEAGSLGLLGSEIPEEYGGDETDKITSIIISENTSYNGSFAVTFGGQVGIGTLPIVYFGNKEQKQRYLPDLVSGEKLSAYALTEPEAGTDALNCQTKAVLSDDGKHYILNGTKQFITTADWAEVFIVYARVDGEKLTAFIVDRSTPGLSIGPEEKKMGLKGTSTCSMMFDDCPVPVENVLHKVGKGHQVAFNILNIGRFKLGAVCMGSSKRALEASIEYAVQRVQFKKPIADFNMTKEKIADMVILIYAMESMVFRSAGLMEKVLADVSAEVIPDAIREYALEYSINKVYCSEAYDRIVDMAVQVYGGYGYCQDYPVERMYRDSRVNRIFEGTNEINRVLIPSIFTTMAANENISLEEALDNLEAFNRVAAENTIDEKPLQREALLVSKMKALFLFVVSLAVKKYGDKLPIEQEILKRLADIAAEIFATESSLLRACKIRQHHGEEVARYPEMITECLVDEAIYKVFGWARDILGSTLDAADYFDALKRIDLIACCKQNNIFFNKREIAGQAYQAKGYFLDY